MKRSLLTLMCLLYALVFPHALHAVENDERRDSAYLREFIVPAALVASGAFVHGIAHESLDVPLRTALLGKSGVGIDTSADSYLRFVPVLMSAGLCFLDVPSLHSRPEILVEAGLSMLTMAALVQGMKLLVNSPRPNGMDNRSFPSGHCALAFSGAELVRHEYGWKWGAAAYGAATAVAVLRLYNDAHWFSDVLAGAGIGILSARLSEVLLASVCHLLKMDAIIAPAIDPVSGTLCASLAFNF